MRNFLLKKILKFSLNNYMNGILLRPDTSYFTISSNSQFIAG